MIAARAAVVIGCASAIAVAGCGGDDRTIVSASQPRTVTATPLPQTPAVRDAPVADGRRVFERSGCLACHQIGTQGAAGPGEGLTGIGARRSRAEIRQALIDPPSPMPSYRELERRRLDDLVSYLSALRSSAPLAGPCPEDADCG